MSMPRTQYALSGDVSIAYQVVGDGPVDVVLVSGWLWQIEHLWEEPSLERFFERMSSFARLIIFDRRGCGLSDRVSPPPTLEQEVDDVVAVMDAAGSSRAAMWGYTGGGPLAVMLAARRPERVIGLILYAAIMRNTATDDFDWTHTEQEREDRFATMAQGWGDASNFARAAPSRVGDARFADWLARLQRLAASPGTMLEMVRASADADVRDLLPELRVPTLVMHRAGDQQIDVRHSRFIAEQIPGARYAELAGEDHIMTLGDSGAVLDEAEEFLTGGRRGAPPQRALLTVMFTDIVNATGRVAQLGDDRWRDLLASHATLIRKELRRFGGHEVKTIGDGVLATFDGAPSPAVRCALAICESVRDLDIEVRVGMHTGECEIIGDDVGGMAVHIAARVGALAQASEVLVSGTVRGTVVGSGLEFEYRGSHALKGVPFEWPLFAVAA